MFAATTPEDGREWKANDQYVLAVADDIAPGFAPGPFDNYVFARFTVPANPDGFHVEIREQGWLVEKRWHRHLRNVTICARGETFESAWAEAISKAEQKGFTMELVHQCASKAKEKAKAITEVLQQEKPCWYVDLPHNGTQP